MERIQNIFWDAENMIKECEKMGFIVFINVHSSGKSKGTEDRDDGTGIMCFDIISRPALWRIRISIVEMLKSHLKNGKNEIVCIKRDGTDHRGIKQRRIIRIS